MDSSIVFMITKRFNQKSAMLVENQLLEIQSPPLAKFFILSILCAISAAILLTEPNFLNIRGSPIANYTTSKQLAQYANTAEKQSGDNVRAKKLILAIDALGGKWCENHFQCLGCFVSLSDLQRTSFLDFDGKPFCRRCFERLPWSVRSSIKKYREKEKSYV
jgi:hypothetical protein